MGVTERTARNHRSPTAAQGSPLYRHLTYLDAVDDPWRIEAATRAHVMLRTLRRLTNAQLIERISELLRADATAEGCDNAAKATRGLSLAERAVLSERDAAIDIELAACYRLAAERGLKESDVMDQWSPR
jgi:hypothetical protein